MSAEDEPEDEGYEPVPERVMDGEVLIADPWEFFEVTNGLAAIVRDGALFVLDRDTRKWRNVEEAPRAATVQPLHRTKQ
jgi:hypothetical protein